MKRIPLYLAVISWALCCISVAVMAYVGYGGPNLQDIVCMLHTIP